MSITFSTGAKIAMLGIAGLKGGLTGAVIELRSGTRPTSADAASTGTLLATIYTNGDGVTPLSLLAVDANGVLAKDPTVVWRGMAVADGTIGYARMKLPADTGATSATAVRLDFTAAVSGADANISSLTATASPSSPHTVDTFTLSF